jgi:hypothetical protein
MNKNVTIFIKTFQNTRVYNGRGTDTVKDLKRFIRDIYSLPTYECSLVYVRYLTDSQLLYNFDECTIHLMLKLVGGPVELLPNYYDSVTVNVVLPNCIQRLTVNVKPYWYISGRTGLISRILEELDTNGYQDAIGNFDDTNVQLIYNGKKMSPESQLVHYPGLTSKYLQFTQISGIVKSFYECGKFYTTSTTSSIASIEGPPSVDTNNPYGYITPVPRGSHSSQGKMLILELKNDKTLSYEICYNCTKCNTDRRETMCIFLRCGHSLCLECGQQWNSNNCPICNKTIF